MVNNVQLISSELISGHWQKTIKKTVPLPYDVIVSIVSLGN